MSLRARILLIFLVTGAAGGIGLFRWMSTEMEPRYLEAQEELLVDISHVLASLIETTALTEHNQQTVPDSNRIATLLADFPQRQVDARIYALHKQSVDLRVYVTDQAGRVVFDSDEGRDLGEDYSGWRDVSRTLLGEYGARTTGDDPLFLDGSVMYVGAPLRHQDVVVGVVSVGKPTRNAERFLAAAIQRFGGASIIALVSAFLIALVIYRWVSLPLQRLYDYAQSLRSGQRTAMPDLGSSEIANIGQAMSELRSALDGKAYVERYVESLTHELKSPTAAIRGAAELLQEDMSTEDRNHFIGNIRSESERLQLFIDRMLALSALENQGDLDVSKKVDMATLIEKSVQGLSTAIHNKALQIESLLVQKLRLKGDPFLLQLAIDNLVKNAVEFSPSGGRILIEAQEEGGQIIVKITDSGPGIPDYARERIFERFYSLQRPDGRKSTGLGLNIVHEIVVLHGGQIQLIDADGGGTCAMLSLPIMH